MRYGEGVAEAFSALAANRSLEWVAHQREVDADRRHERRLRAVAEAMRTAVVGNGEVFSADANVEAMALAAVREYERRFGR